MLKNHTKKPQKINQNRSQIEPRKPTILRKKTKVPPGAPPRSPNGPQEPLPQRRKEAKMAPRSHQVEPKWEPEESKTNPKMIIVVLITFSLQNLRRRTQNEAKMLPSRNQIRHNMVTVDWSPSSLGPERVYCRRQLRSFKNHFQTKSGQNNVFFQKIAPGLH